jgi:hypothetical protein
MMNGKNLVCAGRAIPNARDQIRRYCGLPWSGGYPEIWAYEYYDSIATGPGDLISPADLLPSAALHPGFGRAEAVFFNSGGAEACEEWLSGVPVGVDLADADAQVLDHLGELPHVSEGIGLSIVSKVTHRKRPKLIPLFDRAVVDRYRQLTGLRGEAAWLALLRTMKADLALADNRSFLANLRKELEESLTTPVPSDLRLLDIAIWMDHRGEPTHER